MPDFKPPKPNKAIIGLAEFLLPFYLRFVERLSFRFSENEGRPSQFLKGKKAVVVLNHSDRQDPLVLIALAKHLNEEFYCVVARESFDVGNGILGWIFQRLGCFSVDRGTTDFKSIHTMKKIVTDGHQKLIVFPEGEVTGNDHRIHEIGPALMHIFLNAQKQITEDDATQSLWILPVGVSYKLETELHDSIDNTLTKIEQSLGVESDRWTDVSERAISAVGTLLQRLSSEYEFTLPAHLPKHEQAQLLARHICERISAVVEFTHDQDMSTEQLLYCLRSEISKLNSDKEIESTETNAEVNHSAEVSSKELDSKEIDSKDINAKKADPEQTKDSVAGFHAPELRSKWLSDFDRAERLLIAQRVLNQQTSPIQICRVTDYLESEIFGRMSPKGKQKASVFFGKPIEVLDFLSEYETDKTSAVEQLRNAVHDGLQSALDHTHTESGSTLKQVSKATSVSRV